MLDVNRLAQGHTFCSVRGVKVNRSNELAAFAIDTVGRRIYTLRVKDLASGKMLEDQISAMTGNFEWADDGLTLFYTRQDPETLRPYQVYRHRLGTDPGTDVFCAKAAVEINVATAKTVKPLTSAVGIRILMLTMKSISLLSDFRCF